MTDPGRLAESFVGELRGALGERLQAAALFGSAARGEWIEGVSDINVLVLLDDIDAPILARAAPTASAAVRRGVRPLLMEVDEWARAADVFAIELADMQDAHVPLLGADPVGTTLTDAAHLRLQAERELRGKLLHLHSGMLLAADDSERLGQLFVHALPSFVTYLRTALRLAGDAVPATTREVINHACSRIGADADAFLTVLEARAARTRIALTLTDALPDKFNHSAERLAAYIDEFGR